MVRFIEFMPLDAEGRWRRDRRRAVARGPRADRRPLAPRRRSSRPTTTAPAERFRFVDGGGEIGVIASVTQPFCGTCNRLRLTADGAVRNCLFSDDELSVRGLLRGGRSDDAIAAGAAPGRLGQAPGPRDRRARVPPSRSHHVDDRGLAGPLRLFGPARDAAGVRCDEIPAALSASCSPWRAFPLRRRVRRGPGGSRSG